MTCARRCDQRTEWGRCQQPAAGPLPGHERKKLCSFHLRWACRPDEPDATYHRKIVLGLLQPLDTILSEDEVVATLHGRPRNDGRRMDNYCLDDWLDETLAIRLPLPRR